MPRDINLRQIEAFKAVIEQGTISRAAELLHVSQPAMSKLILNLEFDTGLRLFDRVKGRLAPTEQGMRLYDEIGRIFAGVRQVNNAVDVIRREDQGRLSIGVMPALAGAFIERATTAFLKDNPKVFCAVQARTSQWVVEWLITRKLDVGLILGSVESPYLVSTPLAEHPLVCVMAPDHPLASKREVRPTDLIGTAFVSLDQEADIGNLTARMFEQHGVAPQIAMVANTTPTLCEFVASGLGVSLIHPLMAAGLEHKLVARRFAPSIFYHFQICHSRENRNGPLIAAFANEVRTTATRVVTSIVSDC